MNFMLSPNAETIEGAADNLTRDPAQVKFPEDYPALNTFMLESQLKELDAFGHGRLIYLRAIKLPDSLYGMPDDFRLGYLLGVQTARMVLLGSAALALKGLEAKDIL
jgi:hypothetical protein